jgi:hypothetical protein
MPGTRVGIPVTLAVIPETLPGIVVVAVKVGSGAVTTGVAGIAGGATPGPAMLANGDKLGVGIVAQEPTPRLAISQEASGIPVLGLPPGVVGAVDIGADGDIGGPFDAKLHIPETPTVSVEEVVDIPEVGNIPGSIDVRDGDGMPAISVLPDVAMVLVIVPMPAVAAVAVVADPIAIPPPS